LLWLGFRRLCWIGVERVHTLVSFLTLREMVQFFPIKYNAGYLLVGFFLWLHSGYNLASNFTYSYFLLPEFRMRASESKRLFYFYCPTLNFHP
jgi:hypothetical protein